MLLTALKMPAFTSRVQGPQARGEQPPAPNARENWIANAQIELPVHGEAIAAGGLLKWAMGSLAAQPQSDSKMSAQEEVEVEVEVAEQDLIFRSPTDLQSQARLTMQNLGEVTRSNLPLKGIQVIYIFCSWEHVEPLLLGHTGILKMGYSGSVLDRELELANNLEGGSVIFWYQFCGDSVAVRRVELAAHHALKVAETQKPDTLRGKTGYTERYITTVDTVREAVEEAGTKAGLPWAPFARCMS